MKKIFEKIIVFSAVVLMVAFSALLWIVPDKGISQLENRTLQKLPTFSMKKVMSGKYTTEIGKYLSDQFPLRDVFVGVKAYSELALGKAENNGVLYTKGSVLIPRDEIKQNRLSENLKIIDDFAKAINKSVTIVPIPRSIDANAERLPKAYPNDYSKHIWQEFGEQSALLNAATSVFLNGKLGGDDYYRTDHHYNTKGAYSTYCALGEKLGYEPMPQEYFYCVDVADDFCGTSMRTSGFYLAKKDTITLYRYENDTEYIVCADGEEISLYDFQKLETVDKYAVFLGGNHARVDISDPKNGKERLLIMRDSFADSLAPFLAIHYDITLIDLRYFTDSVRGLVGTEEIDKVLVLESISELSGAKNISVLAMD